MHGTPTAPKLTTRPGTEVIPGVRIFTPGPYEFQNPDGTPRVETFSGDDLRQMHDNFHALYPGDGHTWLKPLVTVSHRPTEDFAEDDPRCHGVVGPDLHFRGDELFASLVDVPRTTKGMVDRGELRNGSPEIRRRFRDRGRDYGHVLVRFALLGKDQPRVKRGELPYQFADPAVSAASLMPHLPRSTYFLPVADHDSVLCFSEALTVTTAAEPVTIDHGNQALGVPNPPPAPDPRLDKLLAFADRLPDLLAVADRLPAIQATIDRATASAETADRLEADRLDREKREKVRRFLDEPGVCFADDRRQLRVLPVQRAFMEESLLREDAAAVLTFADGDRQVQGTALDRKMAEIRRWPPTLHFGEKMGQPGPDPAPDPQLETRVLEATPWGKAELARRKSGAAPAASPAVLPPGGMTFLPAVR